MSLIPDEVIAEIRDRADVVALIGEHVQLRKAGINHKGLCPFHNEKSPSFNVHPARRSYYCFGCQRKGDIFAFLMELQGKSFVEVAHELAARTGVTIPERPTTPEESARRNERSRLLDLNAVAAAFFRRQLLDGKAGRAYLASRGIGEAVAQGFQLGLAPDAWDGLARHLEAERQPAEIAILLGLIAPRNKSPGFYDKFRNRLICPVILPAGEIAGFSGRTLGHDPETPKYLNSPESPVYKKSHLLFGIHAARPSWSKKGRALLVEGNFDVIALHQAGFTEAVAPLGTALTAEQVEVLRRLAPAVVLCLDGDKAGRAAVLRAVPLLVHAGVEARVAALPDGEDPDSFVRRQGTTALEERIARAQPAVEYFLDEIWRKSDHSPERLAAALAQGAPLIAGIGDEVKRAIVIDQFALALGVDPRIVRMALNRQAPGSRLQAPAPDQSLKSEARSPKPPLTELNVLAILADHPDLFSEAEALGVRSLLTDARLRDMYSAALQGRSFLDAAPQEISDLVARKVEEGAYSAVSNPRRTLHETVRILQFEQLDAERDRIGRELKDAERRGDSALAKQLLSRHIETRNRAEALKRRPKLEDPEDDAV